jgi:hypothetical protein
LAWSAAGARASILNPGLMLTGNLVRVKLAKERVVPLYIDR